MRNYTKSTLVSQNCVDSLAHKRLLNIITWFHTIVSCFAGFVIKMKRKVCPNVTKKRSALSKYGKHSKGHSNRIVICKPSFRLNFCLMQVKRRNSNLSKMSYEKIAWQKWLKYIRFFLHTTRIVVCIWRQKPKCTFKCLVISYLGKEKQ